MVALKSLQGDGLRWADLPAQSSHHSAHTAPALPSHQYELYADSMGFRTDASIAGQATGAMSYAFISALKKNPQQSYVQLFNAIRDELEGKYGQKPQLSCSHPLNVNLLYVM